LAVPRASAHVFKFCTPELNFDVTEGVRSHFQVFVARTHFRRNRGRWVPVSCFVRPDSFSAIKRVPGPVYMFCTHGLIFGGVECVRSHFYVLRSRTHFRWYRGRLDSFPRASSPVFLFCAHGSFPTVSRSSGPVFMFCAPGLVFGGTEGVGSRFQVLCSQTRFRRYRGRRLLFSCFARPDSFLAIARASCPVFMFCAPELIFGGPEGVGSRFHLLGARTCFLRCRSRQVPFSCFARRDLFLSVRRLSCPVFMFCATGHVFGGTAGIGSRFHVLRAPTHFRRYRWRQLLFSCFVLPDSFSTVPRASGPFFMFCAAGLIFDGTEGVGSRFHVSRARTCFCQYGGCRVQFSCFAPPDMFSTVLRASGPVFMFCAPRLVFGGIEGVSSYFQVLCFRTCFRRYRGSRFPFSCFALPDSFPTVPRASETSLKFFTPGLIFGGTEGVGSRFHFLCAQTRFRRSRGRRVPFSCFGHPDMSFAVPKVSGPVLMFCSSGVDSCGT
jgi:hypothetical protein